MGESWSLSNTFNKPEPVEQATAAPGEARDVCAHQTFTRDGDVYVCVTCGARGTVTVE